MGIRIGIDDLMRMQRRVAELKQLGWLDTDRRGRRGAHGGGKLRGGNAYYPKVHLPDLEPQLSNHMPWSNRPATVTVPISARQTETTADRAGGSVDTSGDLNPQVKPRRQQSEQISEHLTEQKQGEWGTGEGDKDEHEPIAAVLEVSRQHEPTWVDLRLDGDGILDRLRAQLGDVEVLSVTANDRRRLTTRPPGAG